MSSIRRFASKPKRIVRKLTIRSLGRGRDSLAPTPANDSDGTYTPSHNRQRLGLNHNDFPNATGQEVTPDEGGSDTLYDKLAGLVLLRLPRTLLLVLRRPRDTHEVSPSSSLRSATRLVLPRSKPLVKKRYSVYSEGRSRNNRKRNLTSNRSRLRLKKTVAAKAPAYPSHAGVKYRPDRIQSLSADHEVVLKQVWCYLLKYWGYSVDIDPADVKHRELFVALTLTGGLLDPALLKISTRNLSLYLGKQKYHEHTHVPRDLRRILDIQAKCHQEQYQPIAEPLDDIINVFVNWHKLNFEHRPDYSRDLDAEDANGVASEQALILLFVTAASDISEPDDISDVLSRNGDVRSATPRLKQVKKTPREEYPRIHEGLVQVSPEKSHDAMYLWLRQELPDDMVLKWCRARKFNTNDILSMLGRTLAWRTLLPVEQWLNEGDSKVYNEGQRTGFIKNFLVEKSWINGTDHDQNPVYWFEARKHFGLDLTPPEMTHFVVLSMEWARLWFQEVTTSKDTLLIVFDLTGFSLKNADYTTIKFLAEALEAHYPELLGSLLIYNAPWIFSTVWNIIKHWIDPHVAAKIHFCKAFKDLKEYIDPVYIPQKFGGADTSGPEYPVPTKNQLHPPLAKDANYQRLMKERDLLYMRFLDATRRWVESTLPEVLSKYLEEKIGLSTLLLDNYLAIDPYIRNPGIYDRKGNFKLKN